jgi:hypothetical protein
MSAPRAALTNGGRAGRMSELLVGRTSGLAADPMSGPAATSNESG